jgi:Mn2+/Fe2+ NRAMP family transporter
MHAFQFLTVCSTSSRTTILSRFLTSQFPPFMQNQWVNVLQSVQVPFALLPLLMLASSTSVMGAFVISRTRTVTLTVNY